MRIYVRMQRKNETERVNEGNRQGRENTDSASILRACTEMGEQDL